MSPWGLGLVAALVLAYAAFSGSLARRDVTAPMVFLAAGLLFGVDGLGIVDESSTGTVIQTLTTATLTVFLFADAVSIDEMALRRERSVPVRLLGLGLPLTIVAGTLVAWALFPELDLWGAAVLAVVLAPTDAGLGQAVVTDTRLPTRIRQGLNVESGLNDGICVPLLLIALEVALSAEGASAGDAATIVAEEIGFGLLGGVVAGALGALVLRTACQRGWVDGPWKEILWLLVPALAYGVADPLGGSGFVAAFAAGFTVRRFVDGEVEVPLPEEAGQLLNALTFLLFGAAVLGPALAELDASVVLYAVVSLTVVRMLPVTVAMVGSHARAPTVAFLGWFGPRGLASIVFVLGEVAESELAGREVVLTVVAVTVALSVYLHGVSAAPLTARYGAWYRSHPRPGDLMESEGEPAGGPPAGGAGHGA